jgi:hypothetical protein
MGTCVLVRSATNRILLMRLVAGTATSRMPLSFRSAFRWRQQLEFINPQVEVRRRSQPTAVNTSRLGYSDCGFQAGGSFQDCGPESRPKFLADPVSVPLPATEEGGCRTPLRMGRFPENTVQITP